MTSELFESLLYEEEGPTIDFKKEQYRFAKATDEEKSEILKDVIGFANAWRRATAYILVGVEEVRGGRSQVIGIPASEQLQDHALQQFVNNLVNTPIRFNYRAFSYEGKQVGIFVIDDGQDRPIHLKKDYGKLEKDKVYVRRGSSTDPTKPATPTEIARMGASKLLQRADILVEFGQLQGDDAIGKRLQIDCELCSVPPDKSIPELRRPQYPHGFSMDDPMTQYNSRYYSDLARYEFLTRLCREVRLTVKNIGDGPATNVRLELAVPAKSGVLLKGYLPNEPRRTRRLDERVINVPPIPRREPGDVRIHETADGFRMVIDCGDLQPGRRVWSDRFYIGAAPTGDYEIRGEVLAHNLPVPQPFVLTIAATVNETTMSLQELMKR